MTKLIPELKRFGYTFSVVILFILLISTCSEAKAFETDPLPSKREMSCLIQNVWFEARNESDAGKLAVIFVTLNRVKDPRWPKSICGVVFQPYAFSWTTDVYPNYAPLHIRYVRMKWKELSEFVVQIMSQISYIVDPTDGSNHYHTVNINPYWAKSMKKVSTVIGYHKFYIH